MVVNGIAFALHGHCAATNNCMMHCCYFTLVTWSGPYFGLIAHGYQINMDSMV
jgi:hypothetical protein